MAVLILPTAAETNKLLRAWGLTFFRAGKDHREYRHSSGKVVHAPRSGRANASQIAEYANLLGVTMAEFLEHPPERTVEQEIEEATVPETALQPESQPAAKMPTGRGKRLTKGPRYNVIVFLHRRGGEMREPSGAVYPKLAAELGTSPTALSQLIGQMEADGQVIRDKVKPGSTKPGLRKLYGLLLCYDGPDVGPTVAGLAPERAHPVTRTFVERTAPKRGDLHPSPIAQPAPVEEPKPEPERPEFRLHPHDIERISDRVVAQLVHRLTVVDREAQLRDAIKDLERKLGTAVEYGQSLKKKLDQATS